MIEPIFSFSYIPYVFLLLRNPKKEKFSTFVYAKTIYTPPPLSPTYPTPKRKMMIDVCFVIQKQQQQQQPKRGGV